VAGNDHLDVLGFLELLGNKIGLSFAQIRQG
jgi:hypothetical protein